MGGMRPSKQSNNYRENRKIILKMETTSSPRTKPDKDGDNVITFNRVSGLY